MADRQVHRCSGCGAALPPPEADEHSLTCRFCGLTTALPERPAPVVVRWDLESTTRQLGRKFKLALLLGLGVAASVVAWSVLRAVRPITEALDSVSDQAERFEASQRPVAVDRLPTLEPGNRWILDVSPPSGGFATFDVVGQLAWARQLAQRWAPDAGLERIEAAPIASNGTVDLTGSVEARVEYRFLSPERIGAWQKEADLKQNVEADFAFLLEIVGGKVMAIVQRGRPLYEKVPPNTDLLPLGELLTRAKRSPTFPDRPFYAGHVTWVDPQGWLWSLRTLSGMDQVPLVRGRTGELF